jgi:preprotein translocase subunit SecF
MVKDKLKNLLPNSAWYDKWHKVLFIIPVALTIFAIVYLSMFFSANGDFMHKDTSLAGGTTITLDGDISDSAIAELKGEFPDLVVRKLTNVRTAAPIASIIETSVPPEEIKPELESVLGYNLTEDKASIEFSGPTLGTGFYKQLIIALIIAFILMSVVIFILFRTIVPSIAIIFAAFADIILPLSIVNYFGLKLSAAGISAFLMLIGYAVDTNILLTTRAIKNSEDTLNKRIFGAFKTGAFMTGTAIIAIVPAFLLITGLPDSFRQIFLILVLGLVADLSNTWLLNAGVIKIYADKKGIK